MPNNSILTNTASMTALQTLSAHNRTLDVTQDRVSTGHKVTGAVDDASSFAIAQGLRSDLKAYAAVQQGMANARGVLTVALAGANTFSDLMGDLKERIISGMNPGNTTQQQAILQQDFSAMLGTMRTVLENAAYNGTNILIETAVPFNTVVGQVNDLAVIADIDGSTLTIRGQRVDFVWANLALEDVTTNAAAQAALAQWETQFQTVGMALGQLGADWRLLDSQDKSIGEVADTQEVGLGNIVDADLAKESARLQALQVKQDLVVTTLSIANTRPNTILQLYKS
ncbi:MAG: flagellin [Alphaproteobacteria bacterium]|nr:flagellin [Alphaproteobacteria bacterium]